MLMKESLQNIFYRTNHGIDAPHQEYHFLNPSKKQNMIFTSNNLKV